ncbi:hypothetical protein GM658_12425 [Pseudoduganella eburnea]|uniref:Uncharacterized protein n=1 Tax=Massilia eburnea TaxID=1776165 RepID=A0A6L6QGB9_9BURK|nr:hypothetical protein [Massilia eburnea]MTW11402.1 hypothetical protein [Massilia eburnea]
MNKNELLLEQARIAASLQKAKLATFDNVAKIAGAVLIIYLVMSGLKEISAANPAGISALAVLVKNLNISGILGYVLAAGSTTAWYLERKGKKRIVEKAAKARHRREANDPYHPSSGLTHTGDTPESAEV